MKKTFVLLVLAVGVSLGVTAEELYRLYDWWYEYYTRKEQGELPLDFWYGDKLVMPVMERYPRATAQLDSMVADSIIWGCSLEWALAELKPSGGPASVLPDSVRREILYYIYRDRLIAMDRPWGFYPGDVCCFSDFYIHGGAGSSEVGWIRFVDILLSEDPCFHGFFTVSWAPCGDCKMGPAYATRMILSAMEEGKLLSYSVNPTWHFDMSFKPCTLYNVPAYKAEIPVEYDFWRFRYQERWSDTLRVFICQKGGYEYLISMSSFLGIDSGSVIPTYERWLEMSVVLSP